MLISSHASPSAKAKKTPVQKPSTESRPPEEFYSKGSWEFSFDGGELETYSLKREDAVDMMQRHQHGAATYTVYGPGGEFKSLSPADKTKRLAHAKRAGLESGVKAAVTVGMVGLVGAGVLGVVGQVGSLLNTMAGGSGAAGPVLGLGALAVGAGLAGLAMGASTYNMEKNSAAPEVQLSGKARSIENGFDFFPAEGSANETPVRVTKETVSPLPS